MKIKSLSTTGFGKFNSDRNWSDFSDGLNVFYGKNEAGKTTVFKMILFLLYGKPDKKKEHLHLTNEDNQRLNVSGSISNRGNVFTLHRNLLSDENSFLGPIEGVAHVPRRTYEDVYALNLDGLTRMNAETWSGIQDLLLSQYSTDTFRTPKAVIEKLSKEVREIKKPTERGNSLIKDLEEKRHLTYLKKKDIQRQLQEAEGLEEKIHQLENDVDNLKNKKARLLHRKELVKNYMPILNWKNEENILKKKLKVFNVLEDFNPQNYDQSKEKLKTLYSKMDETSEKVSKFVMEKRRLLSFLDQEDLSEMTFNEMFQRHILLSEWSLDLKEKEKEWQLLKDQYKKTYEQTFEEKFKDEHINKILSLNYLNLKSLIQEVEEINEEIKVIKRQKRVQGSERSNTVIFFMILLMIGSGVAFYISDTTWIEYLSLFIVGLSFMQLIFQLSKRRLKIKSAESLTEEKELLKKRLRMELKGLKMSSIVEEFMGQEFLSQVIELKHLGERYLSIYEAYLSKHIHYDEQKSTVDGFLQRQVGIDDIDSNPFEKLSQKIEDIKGYKNRIDVINGQTDVLNENLKELETELNALEDWVFKADEVLKDIGDGDIQNGVEALKIQESLLGQQKSITQKLEASIYNQEVYENFEKKYHDSEVKQAYDLNHLEVELSVVGETLNEKIILHGSMKKDWVDLTSSNDYNHVVGVLEAIDQEILEKKELYDRYQIMIHLVKTSDDMFRLKNQPEVFKKAGYYLNLMTDGKYSNLEVVEEDGSNDKFIITVDGTFGKKIVDHRFSKGTLNQVYLSLRLSLVDHLDEGTSKLPICFDELLIEWDEERLNETVKILRKLSLERQVILFTCHKWFVEALKTQENVKVFEL